MKILKIVGITIGVIVLLLLILPAVLPSGYTVERSIAIDRPTEVVFPKVADFEQFTQWDPWSPQDTQASKSLTGAAGEIGAKWAWKGEIMGTGSMTLMGIEANKNLLFKLQFDEPFKSIADNTFTFENLEGKTKVTWKITVTETDYFSRYMNPMMDGMLGKDFETGLNSLKVLCEK